MSPVSALASSLAMTAWMMSMSLGPPATIRLLLRSSTVMRRSVSCTPSEAPPSASWSGRPLPPMPAETASVPPVVGPAAAPVGAARQRARAAAPLPPPNAAGPGPAGAAGAPGGAARAQEELLEHVRNGGGVALFERENLDYVLGGRRHVEGVDQRIQQFHGLVRRRDEQGVAVLDGRDEDVFQQARFDDLAGARVDEFQRRGLGRGARGEGRAAAGRPRPGRGRPGRARVVARGRRPGRRRGRDGRRPPRSPPGKPPPAGCRRGSRPAPPPVSRVAPAPRAASLSRSPCWAGPAGPRRR